MRIKTDCNPHPSHDAPSGAFSALGNAFTPEFLERLRRKTDPPTARQAALSGPWEVEPVWSGPRQESSVKGHCTRLPWVMEVEMHLLGRVTYLVG